MDEKNMEHDLALAKLELEWARALRMQAGAIEDYRQTIQAMRVELEKAQTELKNVNEAKSYWYNRWNELQQPEAEGGDNAE